MSARKDVRMNTANEVGQSTLIGRHLRIIAIESKYEILKLLRTTAFVVPTLTFPVLFYFFFGVAFGGTASGGSGSMGVHLIATYGAFGVLGVALVNAIERVRKSEHAAGAVGIHRLYTGLGRLPWYQDAVMWETRRAKPLAWRSI